MISTQSAMPSLSPLVQVKLPWQAIPIQAKPILASVQPISLPMPSISKPPNYLIKNKPDLTKPVADQYRNNVNSQTAAGISVDVLSSDTDIGTGSVPFQSVVTLRRARKS